jgi:hypothetical protein
VLLVKEYRGRLVYLSIKWHERSSDGIATTEHNIANVGPRISRQQILVGSRPVSRRVPDSLGKVLTYRV